MREQLERLVAWAKAHPWLAAAILGGVVLLGYIAYRRSAGGGGGGGQLFEPAEPPSDGTSVPGFGDAAGGGSGTISFPTPSTSDGGVTTPIESIPAAPAASPFEFSAPDFADAYTDLGTGGSSDFASYAMPAETEDKSVASVAAAARKVSTAREVQTGYTSAVGRQIAAPTQIREAIKAPVQSTQAARNAAAAGIGLATLNSFPGVAPIITAGLSTANALLTTRNIFQNAVNKVKSVISPPVTVAARTPVRPVTAAPRASTTVTPAQRVGKPANYTGWAGSVYYVNGYPSNPIPTPKAISSAAATNTRSRYGR